MGNQICSYKKTDRIVKINGFPVYTNDIYMCGERSVFCYSLQLQLYIILNLLRNDNDNHIMKVNQWINNNPLIDIWVIGVK